MKSLALGAVALLVLGGTTLGSAASLRHGGPSAALTRTQRVSIILPAIGYLKAHRVFLPLQAAATATPGASATPGTPVATGTPSTTATPTGPSYPDPVQLLQETISAYGALNSVHFEDITDGAQTGTEKLHIDAVGDATCKGPAFKAHVRGTDTQVATSQKRSVNYYLIQYGSKFFTKSGKKNSTWKTSTASKSLAFSFSTDNPLACPNASSSSGSGSGGSSPQIKDVVNLGPESFHGVQVWHVRATQVTVDSATGNTSDAQLDFFISQDHFLPYGYNVSVADAKTNITLGLSQLLTKFGKKVTVTKPKPGSKKP
ncbi:MAG: hypothetical protein M3Z66_23530 [Chloroflexota bacterium]|nr:hypothetical protein [Chloroflexota bacterium]